MLSVIVIDFRSYERTQKYVDDILKLQLDDVSCVIVDNSFSRANFEKLCYCFGSNYVEDEEKICQISYHGMPVAVVDSGENLGFARGNNLGAQIALDIFDADYLLFSNNDILFLENTSLEVLFKIFETCPEVALVGPRVIGLDGVEQSPHSFVSIERRWLYHQILWPLDTKISFLRKFSTIYKDVIEDAWSGYVYKVLGAFMLLDSRKFVDAGMFDENTFLYAEEEILSERLKKKGYRVYYENACTIIHEGGASTGTVMNELQIYRNIFESEMYYYRNYLHTNKLKIMLCKGVFEFYFLKKKLAEFFGGRSNN